MLATAEPDTATNLETRPVRLFVHDDELKELVVPGRNLIVPDDDPKQPLYWRWVLDLDQVETLEQRRERYMNDQRPIDMKGFAAASLRSYAYIKDLKYEADALRNLVRESHVDEAHYQWVSENCARYGEMVDGTRKTNDRAAARANLDHFSAELRLLDQRRTQVKQAEKDLLKAVPVRRFRGGQSDMWYVWDAIDFSRRTGRSNEWYEYAKLKQSGRPKGSKTRNRSK